MKKAIVPITDEEAEVLAIEKELKEMNVPTTRPNCILLMALKRLVREFEQFMKTDLRFPQEENKDTYKSSLTYTKFYARKMEIVRKIIDVAVALKVSHPHLKYLHSEVPKVFRETLDEIDIEGKKQSIYKLMNKVLAYQYELQSAITSGQSTVLLENIDVDFMDTFKLYQQALKSLKGGEDWKAYVILQIVATKSAGTTMSAREIMLHSQLSDTAIRDGMEILFDKCKEILTIEQHGVEKRIGLANVYAKYEMVKR